MRKFISFLALILLSVMMVGCFNNDDGEEKQITSVTLIENTLNDSYELNTFDLTVLELQVTYDDKSSENIQLTEDMITQNELNKLSNIGEHTITISYQEFEITFTVNIINGDNLQSGLSMTLMSIFEKASETGSIENMTYEEWLESIQGPQGEAGKEVLLQVAEGYIQWQYFGDTEWKNLVELSTLAGADGDSAYDLYLERYPEYTKSEQEWLDDLVNGVLGQPDTITITFESNGGTFVDNQNIDKYSSIDEPTDPEKMGYEFTYWSYENSEWIFFGYIANQDLVLSANYVAIEYPITYVLDGGINNDNNPVEYTIESDTFVLQEPTKEGYIFTGWTFDGQTIPVKDVSIELGTIGEQNFTANWYEISDNLYNSENAPSVGSGIIDTFYYIEFDDENDSFLLMQTDLYDDGTLLYEANYGLLKNIEGQIYELDFIDEGLTSKYIRIEYDQIIFVNQDGSEIGSMEGRKVYDSNLEENPYGYGYFDLSLQEKSEDMTKLYEDIYTINLSFFNSSTDFVRDDGTLLFAELDLTQYNLTIDEGLSVFKVFILDHPEFYWMSNSVTISGFTIEIYLDEVYADYTYRTGVDQAVNDMIFDLELLIDEDMNELEIVKIIHDYIILRVDYSYEIDGVTPEDDYWAHNIDGIATLKGAVCEGYAETFKVLAKHFGIFSLLVTGNSNDQNHEWNLVRIDDEYYHFDLTWDDSGSDEISYTYFGMTNESISLNHTIDLQTNVGIEYLYQLPVVSQTNITFVELYENGSYVHLYGSIESAFAKMSNTESTYTLSFYDYQLVGPLLWSNSVREYQVPAGQLPDVKKIIFEGNHIDQGSGYFTSTTIYILGDASVYSNIELYNIRLYGYDEVNLDLQSYSLYFTGYHNQTNKVNIIGSVGSTIITQVDYEVESYGEFHVDVMDLNHGPIVLRGKNNTINTVNNNDLNGYLRVYGNVTSVDIGTINLNTNNSEIIKLDNVVNTILTINNINSNTDSDYDSINVRVDNIENMPMIYINGNVNKKIEYWLFTEVTYVSTDLSGVEIERWETTAFIGDYGNTPILQAPNLDFNNFMMRYTNDFYLTELYTKDLEGNFYRDKDFYEKIESGVLSKVIYLNDNLSNTYTIPNSVHTIDSNAFIGYMHLTDLVIPNTVTTVNNNAFSGIREIPYIFIPSSVITADQYAFSFGYATYLFEATEAPVGWENPPTSMTQSVVYGVVEVVDDGEFIYAKTSNNTVSILGISSLNTTLDIIIPEFIEGLPVTQIVREAFRHNSELTSIVIPNTITEISEYAFQGATSLTSVVFTDGSTLKEIGWLAFSSCSSLVEIHIPDSVTFVDQYAFNGCSSLTIYVSSSVDLSLWNSNWNNTYSMGLINYIVE